MRMEFETQVKNDKILHFLVKKIITGSSNAFSILKKLNLI
jgi:hypothetical protein